MSGHEVSDPDDADGPDDRDRPRDAWTVEFTTNLSSGMKRFPTEAEARVWAEHYTERFGATTWILPTEQHQALEADAGMYDER